MVTRRTLLNTLAWSALGSKLGFAKDNPAQTPFTKSKQAQPSRWNPRTTWVFAVGVIKYPKGDDWPQATRLDVKLIDELQKSGVPKQQIIFIRDKDATRAQVARAFAQFLAKAPTDATLWFYFTGHGDKSDDGTASFRLYDGAWLMADVLSTIERHFKGSRGMLVADCCYSGNLCIEATLRAGRISYAVLTSSLASSISTDDWTFTHCLIKALRGTLPLTDAPRDQLDFLALAASIEREMAMNDGQLSTFTVVNGFDPRMIFGSIPKDAKPVIHEYVDAKAKDGHWYPGRIEERKGDKVWIKWLGYDASANEWVLAKDTRPRAQTEHPVGTKVSVEWKDEWHPAEVLAARHGIHLIRYKGYGPTWDEWVDTRRLRLASKE